MCSDENFLENHYKKCRCCFKTPSDSESFTKITKSIERIFYDLTNMELTSSYKIFSHKICQDCSENFKHFDKFRKELINKQKKFYAWNETNKTKTRISRRNEKKLSTQSVSEISFQAEQEHEDLFVKLEVKVEKEQLESESCVVIEPIAMNPFVKLEKINTDEFSNIPDHFYNSCSNDAQNSCSNDACSSVMTDQNKFEDEDEGVVDPFDEFFKNQEKARKKNKYKRKRIRQPYVKHYCPHCEKFFLKEEKLKIHIDYVHFNLKNYVCDKCGYKTYSPDMLRSHEERVHSDKVIEPKPKPARKPCPTCGLLVQSISTHTRNVHTRAKNVFCDICGFGIFNLNRLRRHMYKHLSREEKHSLATYHCDLCGAKLHTKNSISSHIRNLHLDLHKGNVYACHCGKSYKVKAYLKIHQKSHERVRNHKCTKCDKAFMNLSQLKIHLDIHERGNRKDFSCEICGKRYGTENLLHRHKIFHTDPKIPCSYCGKRFHRKCLLERHIRAQHEIEMRECEHCGKQINIVSLPRHIKEFHSNLQRKPCLVSGCSSTFLRKCHMKDHIQRMHKEFLFKMTPTEKEAFEEQLNNMDLL